MPKKPKAPAAVVKSRISDVKALLLEGHGRTYILRYGADVWDLGDRQIDLYIQKATEEIDELTQSTATHMLALITSNLWDIFRLQKDSKDMEVAKATLLDLAKLHGLDNPEMTLNIKRSFATASDEELAQAIAGDA